MITTGGYVIAAAGILLMMDLSRFECSDCAELLYGTPIEIARTGSADGLFYIKRRNCGKRNYFI